MTSPPLLVLGGGIAGLAAADEALADGCGAVIIERESTPGGMLRTDRREGYSFDRGGHRFITALPWVRDRIEELVGDRLLARARRSLVLIDGTTVAYPLAIEDLVRRLGLTANLRALASYLRTRRWSRADDERTSQDLRITLIEVEENDINDDRDEDVVMIIDTRMR